MLGDIFKSAFQILKPLLGLVLGSGLGGIADDMQDKTIIPYAELPGFPVSKVQGHQGNLAIGYLYGKPVFLFSR